MDELESFAMELCILGILISINKFNHFITAPVTKMVGCSPGVSMDFYQLECKWFDTQPNVNVEVSLGNILNPTLLQ